MLLLAVSSWSCGGRPATAATPGVSNHAAARPDSEPAPRYALAAGSTRLLGTLRTTLVIDAYVTKGWPEVDGFVADLTDLLRAYARGSRGKLEFRLIVVDTPGQRELASQAGLQEQVFSSGEAEPRSATSQGFMGLVFKYRDEKTVIPQLLLESQGLEFWVTNKIREIRDRADGVSRRIGVVSGKGELRLSDAYLAPRKSSGAAGPTLQGIMGQAFPFYRFEDVLLGRGAIDPQLAGLIITQPEQDYSDAELRRIDEFLMLGEKSLVVYASAVNVRAGDSTLVGRLSTHRLDQLLDGYGIHMNRDAVFDYGAQFRVQVVYSSGEKLWLRHCGLPLALSDAEARPEQQLLDPGFAGFFRMEELIFPFASSLELTRDRQPTDVLLKAVARSTASAAVESADEVDLNLRQEWRPKPPLEQRILAAYAQGKLKSAFAAKLGADAATPTRARKSSRVLVISSSLFLANPFVYADNGPPNTSAGDPQLLALAQPYTKYLTSTILSFKNALDWISNDDDLIALSATLVSKRPVPRSTNPKD